MEIIDTHQVAAASLDLDPEYDIRPRFFDSQSRQWVLLDTGSQVSACKPDPGMVPDPRLRVEAVDGSELPCYDSHIKVVEEIFKRLSHYGLALSLKKCQFAEKEVEFLGYKISNEGVRPLQYKLDSIQAFEPPKTQKQLLRFLGMLNFYRKTLPNLIDPSSKKVRTPAEVLQDLYTAATAKIPKAKFSNSSSIAIFGSILMYLTLKVS